MPASAKQIKSKIGSVKNVGKITKAMELVSVSKMKRAVETALRTRKYAEYALELLSNLSRERNLKHELLTYGDGGRNLIVLISSNKGLCGSYNVNVLKGAKAFVKRIQAKHEAEIKCITIGKYAEKAARAVGGEVIESFRDIPEVVTWEDCKPVVARIQEEFQSGNYYNVVLVYTHFISPLAQTVVARQILPVKPLVVANMLEELAHERGEEQERGKPALYLFEPNEEELLDAVLPQLMETGFFQGMLESRASEHSARMVAMKNASENAGKMVDELKLTYNRARQAGITQEIAEIASGAEA